MLPVVVNECRGVHGSQVLAVLHRHFVGTNIPLTGLFVVPEQTKIRDLESKWNTYPKRKQLRLHWSQDNVLIWWIYRDAVMWDYFENLKIGIDKIHGARLI